MRRVTAHIAQDPSRHGQCENSSPGSTTGFSTTGSTGGEVGETSTVGTVLKLFTLEVKQVICEKGQTVKDQGKDTNPKWSGRFYPWPSGPHQFKPNVLSTSMNDFKNSKPQNSAKNLVIKLHGKTIERTP